MTLSPSFNPQLEVLVAIVAALIFVGAFLAIFFAAVIALGAVRLLYLGGGWFLKNVDRSSLSGLLGRLPRIRTRGATEQAAAMINSLKPNRI